MLPPGDRFHMCSKLLYLRNRIKKNIMESRDEVQGGGRPGKVVHLTCFSQRWEHALWCIWRGWSMVGCLGRAVSTRWLTGWENLRAEGCYTTFFTERSTWGKEKKKPTCIWRHRPHPKENHYSESGEEAEGMYILERKMTHLCEYWNI